MTAGGTALLTLTAGCSTVVDFLGSQVLREVNILNQLDKDVSGSVQVISPAGDTVLDATFEVPAKESDGKSNVRAYGDVWRDSGEYRISVKLAEREINGVSRANKTVLIENTDQEMVAVSLGSGEEDEPIAVRAGESLSDFGRPKEGG
jgi:hypothetical protein